MSTRSYIGIARPDGKVEYVYCHSDGYPDYNGEILYKYYTTKETVQNLINHGDMSWLAPKIGNYNIFPYLVPNAKPNYHVCCFYGRDRREPNTAKQVMGYTDFARLENSSIEYEYLFFNDSIGWAVRKVPWQGEDAAFIPLEIVLNHPETL